MAPYRYDLLTEPNGTSFELRIVTLLPGNDPGLLEASISTTIVDITTSAASDYHALSYTWGDVTTPNSISILENEGASAELQVGQNLHDALLVLRSQAPIKLWIDAICINQNPQTETEMEEKAWLIKRMHEIYGRATSVIIWLGVSAQDSKLALNVMQKISNDFQMDETTYNLGQVPDATSGGDILTDEAYQALTSLLERPWFRRVWIRQEAFAASNLSSIWCGPDYIVVGDFSNSCRLLSLLQGTGDTERRISFRNGVSRALGVFQRSSLSISAIMSRVRDSQCQFLQDKVYGCLGMMSISGQSKFVSELKIDYEMSVEESYQNFFLQYTISKCQLLMLHHAGLCQESKLDMPSWIPDWSIEFHHVNLDLMSACSHAKYTKAEHMGQGKLQIEAVLSQEVTKTLNWGFLKVPDDLTLDEICEFLKRLLGLNTNTTDETLVSISYVFAVFFSQSLNTMNDIETYRSDVLRMLRKYIGIKTTDASEEDLPYGVFRHPWTLMNLRKIFVTQMAARLPWIMLEGGQLGLGCVGAQQGDIVAAIIGLNNLAILRPRADDQYQFVGSAFVHGLNYGQLLLGSLPQDVEAIPRLVPEWGIYMPYYVNSVTGEASYWDPRIDWSSLEVPEGVGGVAVIKAPLDEKVERQVPTAAYFRKHGTKVENIILI